MRPEHEDPKFDAWLERAAQSYHSPLPTPREEIWARIAAERRRRTAPVIALRPWARWALAAAAMLVLGIGIGRWTATPDRDGAPAIATSEPDAANGESRELAYHIAATQYLSRTEALLTGFRAELQRGAVPARFAGQARDLLRSTQLLLDSPAADDLRLRDLLEDLELVLAQIAQLGAGGGRETDLITQGMEQTNVLPKLRSAIPAGPLPVQTQGVL